MADLLNFKQLKEQASIVELLEKLGHRPVPRRGREIMYHSMLRDDDKTPSFSVNDALGVWFDHGLGKGGNIIDFGLLYWKGLEFNQVLARINEVLALEQRPRIQRVAQERTPVKVPHYVVQQVKAIGTHPAITNYLKGRGIFDVALKCLKEVYYYVEDQKGKRQQYFAGGWQNENAGWEVRNKYFKGCLGKKAITFIDGHEKNAAVFEGYLDYLSWRVEHPQDNASIIVMNSLSLLSSGIARGKRFSSIDLYFDRDPAGLRSTRDFIAALPYATDRSGAYEGFNDYNDKIKAQLKPMQQPDQRSVQPDTSPMSFSR